LFDSAILENGEKIMVSLRDVLERELGRNSVLSVDALLAKRGQARPASLRQLLSRVSFVVSVTEMKANKTTEGPGWNDVDEIYLAFVGGSSRVAFSNPRVYRTRSNENNDYTSFRLNQGLDEPLVLAAPGIENGVVLEAGEFAAFTVAILEQDNAQLPAILGFLGAAALTAGSLLVGAVIPAGAFATAAAAALSDAAKSQWKASASSFIESLSHSGDQVVGAFQLFVLNDRGTLKFTWSAEKDTTLLGPADQPSALFHAAGSEASYTLRVSAQQQ
jgi:hypothetical protein